MNVLVVGDDPFVFDAELFHQPAAVEVFFIDQDVDFGQDKDHPQGDINSQSGCKRYKVHSSGSCCYYKAESGLIMVV